MNTRKRLLVATILAACVLVAWPAVANLIVSYTLVPVSITEMSQLTVRPGSGAGEITATGYFNIKDVGGVVRERGSVAVTLNSAQKTALLNFINTNIVPPFNTQRGL